MKINKENWIFYFIGLYLGAFFVWAFGSAFYFHREPTIYELLGFCAVPILVRIIAEKFNLFDI